MSNYLNYLTQRKSFDITDIKDTDFDFREISLDKLKGMVVFLSHNDPMFSKIIDISQDLDIDDNEVIAYLIQGYFVLYNKCDKLRAEQVIMEKSRKDI